MDITLECEATIETFEDSITIDGPSLEGGVNITAMNEEEMGLFLEELKASVVENLSDNQLFQMMGIDAESLLERLRVDKVIAAQSDDIDSKILFPITKELTYNYDFGDDWVVTITKYKDCENLLKENLIDTRELEEAKEIVLTKHKPICISKDGIFLLDDVGGLAGFADLLSTIYEEDNKTEKANTLAWAKSQGWRDKKISCKKML
jgi:hypothetical protein